jgi:hypothetical protein
MNMMFSATSGFVTGGYFMALPVVPRRCGRAPDFQNLWCV